MTAMAELSGSAVASATIVPARKNFLREIDNRSLLVTAKTIGGGIRRWWSNEDGGV
jgi:hypothetical protein